MERVASLTGGVRILDNGVSGNGGGRGGGGGGAPELTDIGAECVRYWLCFSAIKDAN
jgi:hypothetical protein